MESGLNPQFPGPFPSGAYTSRSPGWQFRYWLNPEERTRFLNLLAQIGENVVIILSTHIEELDRHAARLAMSIGIPSAIPSRPQAGPPHSMRKTRLAESTPQ